MKDLNQLKDLHDRIKTLQELIWKTGTPEMIGLIDGIQLDIMNEIDKINGDYIEIDFD